MREIPIVTWYQKGKEKRQDTIRWVPGLIPSQSFVEWRSEVAKNAIVEQKIDRKLIPVLTPAVTVTLKGEEEVENRFAASQKGLSEKLLDAAQTRKDVRKEHHKAHSHLLTVELPEDFEFNWDADTDDTNLTIPNGWLAPFHRFVGRVISGLSYDGGKTFHPVYSRKDLPSSQQRQTTIRTLIIQNLLETKFEFTNLVLIFDPEN